MILATTECDLDCTHQGSEPAGLRPVEARGKTIKKTGAIRIAATGGIHHLDRPDARNLDPFAVRVDDRPLCATGENECLEFLRHVFELAAGPLLEHPAFIVVDGDVAGLVHESEQLLTGKHRQSLTGVEHERNAEPGELARVLQHALASIGRDDREARIQLSRGEKQ